jgi:hypothetical protein
MVKISLILINYHAMKTVVGVEVYIGLSGQLHASAAIPSGETALGTL